MRTRIEIYVDGDTQGDVNDAVSEVRRLIAEGFTSGSDRNETGRYRFDMTDAVADAETAVFVCASNLVPVEWRDWFWQAVSEGAPFSWGDNNRTLVTARRFLDHCETVFHLHEIDEGVTDGFVETLLAMGDTYIDLEN